MYMAGEKINKIKKCVSRRTQATNDETPYAIYENQTGRSMD